MYTLRQWLTETSDKEGNETRELLLWDNKPKGSIPNSLDG